MKRILLLLLGALFLMTGCGNTPHSEIGPTVEIGGQTVVVDDELEENQLTSADFTTDPETGRITCLTQKAATGIDVSSHQGEIDWAAVAQDGIDFAILRIASRGYTAGGLKADPMFEQNYAGAREQGLDVGVYIFSQAISKEEGREEAEFVLELLGDKELQLPVVFDWEEVEDPEARTAQTDSKTVTDAALAFCETVERAGHESTVYCNGMVGYLRYDLTRMQELNLWYAKYGQWPEFAYKISLWQYSNTGKVAGIQGNTDLNLRFMENVIKE